MKVRDLFELLNIHMKRDVKMKRQIPPYLNYDFILRDVSGDFYHLLDIRVDTDSKCVILECVVNQT